MKSIFFNKDMFLTLLFIFFSLGLFSQNLLNNPGIENGIDNWWVHQNTAPAKSSISTHTGGNAYFQSKSGLLETTTAGTQFFHVNLENTKIITGLSVGQEYVAAIWAKAKNAASDGKAFKISLKITNTSGQVSSIQKTCILATYYQRYEVSHIIASDFLNLKYQIYTGASEMGVYIDDAQYKKKTYNSTPFISSLNITEVEVEDDVFKTTLSANALDPDNDNLHYAYAVTSGGGSIGSYGNYTTYEPNGATGNVTIKVTVTDNKGDKATETKVYTNDSNPTNNYYIKQNLWNEATDGSTNAAYRFTANNPNLPNVLLIGTSISVGYTNKVQDELSGEANVYRIPENSLNTETGKQKIAYWLSNMDWDVIHFNWGLHDLKYSNNNQNNQDVPPADYEDNMRDLVDYMKDNTNAKLIWASTTVVPVGLTDDTPRRYVGDDKVYNDIAISAMSAYSDIAFDDQYTLTKNNPSYQKFENVHFTATGYDALGTQAANRIRTALDTSNPSPATEIRLENVLGGNWLKNQLDTVICAPTTNTGENTKWLKTADGVYFSLKNQGSGYYLSISGTDVILTNTYDDKAKWKFTATGSNWFIDNKWCLDNNQNARLKFLSDDVFVATTANSGDFVQWTTIALNQTLSNSVLSNETTTSGIEVKIIPNPSDGNITVSFDQLISTGTWKIANISGQLVSEGTLTNKNEMELSIHQGQGLYFLSLVSKNGIHTVPIMITK